MAKIVIAHCPKCKKIKKQKTNSEIITVSICRKHNKTKFVKVGKIRMIEKFTKMFKVVMTPHIANRCRL